MNQKEEIINWVVKQIAGEDAIELVLFILNNPDLSEFKVVERLELNIKELRNIIYNLMDYDLLKWRRKKDRQKGWYIYYWTIKQENFPFLYKKLKLERLNKLEGRLNEEKNNQFFVCPNLCLRASYEKAMDVDFSCPECGSILIPQDNTKTILFITKQIEILNQELGNFSKILPSLDFSPINVEELPKVKRGRKKSKNSDEDDEEDDSISRVLKKDELIDEFDDDGAIALDD